MEKRIIPTKNYLIFAVIAILSFSFVYNLAEWYKTTKDDLENKSVMTDAISEILSEEIDNYIIDNSSVVIYMSSSKDITIKDFEKAFKDIIIEKEISDQIIYLDTNKVLDDDFYSKLEKKYFSAELKSNNINLNHMPNIIVFKDRKIISVLLNDEAKINLSKVENFLINNEIIVN